MILLTSHREEFLIRFGGDTHIRVETLTDFLSGYRKILYEINSQLGFSEGDLIVEVSPPEEGSFKIKLSPKYENHLVGTLSGIVAGTLSGLLLAWILSSDKVLSIEDVQKIIESTTPTNQTEITNNVYNIYQKVEIKQTLNNTFKVLENDDNINSLDISQNEKEIINIPKTDFKKYIKAKSEIVEEDIETEKIENVEISLIVKTIHFEGNAKWAFIWRGYQIKASIKDEEFLKKLNTEAFKRGDILRVELQKRSVYNEDLGTYIIDENSYEIIKVIKHNSNDERDNLKLSFNEK